VEASGLDKLLSGHGFLYGKYPIPSWKKSQGVDGQGLKKIFAERLRMYKSASGLSAAELAARAGVSRGTLSKYQNPDFALFPSFDVLVRLAKALEAPLGVLVGLESPDPDRHTPKWVSDLMPDLASLDVAGRESVKALVRGLKK
jgi:transcriptional regulator with XRE-family HTH domain